MVLPDNDSDGAVLIKDPNKCRKCPVCKDNLHLYHINEENMFLMCENNYCEFPFGYEPLQIVQDETQLVDKPLKCTKEFFEYPVGGINGIPPTPLGSIHESTAADSVSTLPSISDNDHGILEDDDMNSIIKEEPLSIRLNHQSQVRKYQNRAKKDINKNLQNIIEMNKQLKQIAEDEKKSINYGRVITNSKWLKNLKKWEENSNTKLLTAEEKVLLNKTEPSFSLGELKISIDSDSKVPLMNIEILEHPVKTEL